MPKINLLPWREEKRKELQTQFNAMLGVVAILAIAAWAAVHFYHVQLVDVENSRIALIDENITVIDKKIEEIKELEEEEERLLSRMHAIEQLQGNRPLIVRFFDELLTSLPDGVTVASISQKEAAISVSGLAQSNARVSSFMRKLNNSKWLTNPDLKVVEESGVGDDKLVNSFTLTFSQIIPEVEEGDS